MNPHHTTSPSVTPTCLLPSSLTTLAARAVARCLTYEDYEDCCHYRWDPVNIWQFEIPYKKKKGKKASERSQMFSVNEATVPPPKPAWQEIRKFRDWWWETRALGSMDSVLRGHIFTAFKQLSWTAHTEEEYILFLLLRICIETKIELGCIPWVQGSWCGDLANILTQLGPFPLLKLYVSHDSLGLKPLLISLVQQSPHLQVLHVNQWALSNDFMSALGSHCRMLTEFAIPFMQPQVFMSDEALFTCFYNGLGSSEVLRIQREGGESPTLSFSKLRVVDIFYWKQTERFIHSLSRFYPNVRLKDLDFNLFGDFSEPLSGPLAASAVTVPAMGATFRLFDAPWDMLNALVKHSPHLTALHTNISDPLETVAGDTDTAMHESFARLERLVTRMTSLESLVVRHSSVISPLTALAPALRAKGACITSLQLCMEGQLLDIGALYKVVNLCPRLCVLGLVLDGWQEQSHAAGLSTLLQPCHNLHTLAVFICTTACQEREHLFPFRGIYHLLQAAHNLKRLGLSCSANAFTDCLSGLTSETLQSLHIEFTTEPDAPDLLAFLKPLIANFPRLRSLSLNEKYYQVPLQALASILTTSIDVTKLSGTSDFLGWSHWDFQNFCF